MRRLRVRAIAALAVLLGVTGLGAVSVGNAPDDATQVVGAGWAGGGRGVPEGVSAQHNETLVRD